MDTLAELALTALDSRVAALVSGPTPQGLTRAVRVRPLSIGASGLGGYIGTHEAPRGSVLARRVLAVVEIEITGGNTAEASAHLSHVVRKMLSQSRGDLLRDGVCKLALRSAMETRRAEFDLIYEYRHLPSAGEGVIETIALGISTNTP